MELKNSLLARCYPNISKTEAEKLIQLRKRALTDHLFLARLCGFDRFQEAVHKELFDAFVKKDHKKAVEQQDKTKDRLILWPRGHYKTTAVSVDIIQWILNFPNITIGIMTSELGAAKKRLAEVKDKFENCEKLARLFPEYCDHRVVERVFPHIKDAKPLEGNSEEFVSPARSIWQRDPTVQIMTSDSRKAGKHCAVLFCDDLVHENNYQTKELLDATIDGFKDAKPLLDNDQCYRIVIGTRYSFGDLYGWIIDQNKKKRTWKISSRRCWERNPDGTYTLLFPRSVLPNGTQVGFTVEGLEAIQNEDLEKFANQYLNEPIVGGAETFPASLLQLRTCTVHRLSRFPRYQWRVFIAWDTAFGQSASACASAGAVGAYLPSGELVILRIVGGRFGPKELFHWVTELNMRYRPLLNGIEEAAGAPLLTLPLENWVRENNTQFPIEWFKATNKKDAKILRIAGMRQLLDDGKLYFLQDAEGIEELLTQLKQFPKGNKDYADAASRLLEFRTYAKIVNQLPDPFSEADPTDYQTNGLPWGITG